MKKIFFILTIFFSLIAYPQQKELIFELSDSIQNNILNKEKLNYYFNTYINPDDYNGFVKQASVLFQNGLYNEAISNYKEAISIYKNYEGSDSKFIMFKNTDIVPNLLVYIGICKHNLNELDSAIFYCKKALEIKPDFENAFNEITSIYIDQKNFTWANIYANKSINTNPNSGIGYYLKGYINYLTEYSQTNTIIFLKKSIEANPQYDMPYVLLGNFYTKKNNQKKALEYYNLAIKHNTNSLSPYYMKAFIKLNNYDLISAFNTMKAALIKYPYDKDVINYLSVLSFYYDKTEEGVKYYALNARMRKEEGFYNKIERFDYQNEELDYLILTLDNDSLRKEEKEIGLKTISFIMKGGIFYRDYITGFNKINKNTEFLNRLFLYLIIFTKDGYTFHGFNEAVKNTLYFYPEITTLNLYFAKLLIDEDKNKKAILYIDKTIKTNPKKAYSYFLKAHANFKLKENKKAEIELLKAINILPTYSNAYNELGLVYNKLNDKYKSKNAYLKAIKLNPNLYEAYNNLGHIYFIAEQYDSALVNYDKSLELSPRFVTAIVNKSDVLTKQNKLSLAKNGYIKAIKLKPKSIYANMKYGDFLYFSKNYIEALRQYNVVIDLSENYAKAYLKKGNCFYKMGNINKSLQFYKTALNNDSTLEEVNAKIGRAYFSLGKFNECKKYTLKELKTYPENELAILNSATCNLKEGNIEEAKKLYKKINKFKNIDKEQVIEDLKYIIKLKTYKKEAKEIMNDFM